MKTIVNKVIQLTTIDVTKQPLNMCRKIIQVRFNKLSPNLRHLSPKFAKTESKSKRKFGTTLREKDDDAEKLHRNK
jgi:hypothetical protein